MGYIKCSECDEVIGIGDIIDDSKVYCDECHKLNEILIIRIKKLKCLLKAENYKELKWELERQLQDIINKDEYDDDDEEPNIYERYGDE